MFFWKSPILHPFKKEEGRKSAARGQPDKGEPMKGNRGSKYFGPKSEVRHKGRPYPQKRSRAISIKA